MHPELEQLLVLQDRDQKIRQIQTEIETVPLRRTSLEAQLAASASAVDALKHKARQVEGGSCLTENIAVRARPKEVLEAFDQGEHAASHERLTTAVSVAID